MELSPAAEAQDMAWMKERRRLVREGLPFEAHWEVYQAVYAGRAPEDGPPQAWRPVADEVARANLSELLTMSRQQSIEELRDWCVQEPATFWDKTLRMLGINFKKFPKSVVDEQDPLDPKWCNGAELNIVDSCFTSPADELAIIYGGESGRRDVTFGELKTLVDQVSHGLVRHGFQHGDAIALYMPMNVECVAAYLGIIQAGLTVVSIPDSFAPAEVATRLRISDAKAIITVRSFMRGGKEVPMLDKAMAATDGQMIISVGGGEHAMDWDRLAIEKGKFRSIAMPPDAVANILFSSGTTGDPKAIPWTHVSAIKAAADGMLHQDIHDADIVAWPTNIGWMMGPWLIFAALVNEATIVLYDDVPTNPGFIKFLQDTNVSILGVVPGIVRAWRQNDLAQPGDLKHVRLISSTGEASNVKDSLYAMSLTDYGAPVIEYCGGTEIAGGYITGTILEPSSPATFTGAAMGTEFLLLDDGQEVGEGEMGEVFLIPPSLGLSERLLNRDHHKEYYAGVPPGPDGQIMRRHGDQMARLHQGFYTAQGRADDTMNLGGIKVGSIELERAMQGEGVQETAAVAVQPHEGGAEWLVVFAVTSETDMDALRKKLQDRIKQRLNPLFRIHEVVPVDKLPRTASNKVMRRQLRAQYNPS